MNKQIEPSCIKCNRLLEPIVELRTEYKAPYIRFDILCPECRCFECNTTLTAFEGMLGMCNKCYYPWRARKIEEARREGKCILCFVKPQANVLNKGGDKTLFCMDCLIMWTKSAEIDGLNYELGQPIRKITRRNLFKQQ